MQVQMITVLGDVTRAIVYWDTGSNVNLVRQEFARQAGWVDRPVVQRLQTSGRVPEDWTTTCFKVTLVDNLGWEHQVLVFEIGTIMVPLKPVDVSPAMVLFPGKIPHLECIKRPVGEVDLLIGVQNVRLFPVVADLEHPRVGNVRLLQSDFVTGMLLDGVHSAFGPSELNQT